MRMKVSPGAQAQDFVRPTGGNPVPSGLIEALKSAARFTGRHEKKLADGKFVHIADGKVYASNNQHIIEFDVGDLKCSLRLSRRDVSMLSAMGGDPQSLSIVDGKAEFIWPNGCWVRIDAAPASSEFVETCKYCLEHYWTDPKCYPANLTILRGLAFIA